MYTNPAKEVVNMCNFFRDLKHDDNTPVFQVLKSNFLVKGADPIQAITTFHRRVGDLRSLVESLDGEHVDADVRQYAVRSLDLLSKFLSFDQINGSYKLQISKYANDTCISNIRGVYSELNRYHPINTLSSEVISSILSRIDQESIKFIYSSELPPYVKYSLLAGIKNLEFSLKFYHIFGAGNVLGAVYELAKDVAVAEKEGKSTDIKEGLHDLSSTIGNLAKLIQAVNKSYDNAKELGGGLVKFLMEGSS